MNEQHKATIGEHVGRFIVGLFGSGKSKAGEPIYPRVINVNVDLSTALLRETKLTLALPRPEFKLDG